MTRTRYAVLIAALIAAGSWIVFSRLGSTAGSAGPWRHSDGRVAAERYTSPDVPAEHAGPSHCDWQSATFIAYRNGQFVRDTKGKVISAADRADPAKRYEANARLPADATFTGWRRGTREIWTAPSDATTWGERPTFAAIYIVSGGTTERLPLFRGGCR